MMKVKNDSKRKIGVNSPERALSLKPGEEAEVTEVLNKDALEKISGVKISGKVDEPSEAELTAQREKEATAMAAKKAADAAAASTASAQATKPRA